MQHTFTLPHASLQEGYTHNVQKWLKCYRRNVDHCRDEREGGTALHWAAYYGRLDIVKMLIENGASMGLKLILYNEALHVWSIVGFVQCNGVY